MSSERYALGVNQATYLTGGTGPLYRRDDIANAVRWYIQDGLGSVLAEVDPSGNVTGSRKVDAYGISRGTTGTLTSKHGFVGTLGHTSEPETGLIYMRARYYDPQVGRFISEDPSCKGPNWFRYVSNCPTGRVDRSGKDEGDLESTLTGIIGGEIIDVGLAGAWGNVVIDAEAGIALFDVEVYMSLGRGALKILQLMNAIRAWATSGDIGLIVFRGATSPAGQEVLELAARVIIRMGDEGLLATESTASLLYWLIQ